MATTQATLDELTRRLQLLEDEREILGILNRYPYGFDYSRDQDWLDLFAGDAVLEIRLGKGASPRKYEGIAALRQWTAERPKYAGLPLKAKHMLSAPVISVDGDEATVECGLAVLVTRPEGTAVASYARYEDRLVKRNGRWKIQHLIVHGES